MDIYSVQLSQLTHMKKYSSDYSNLDEDYIFSRINIGVAHLQEESRPMRINGLTMLLCLEGGFGIDVNKAKSYPLYDKAFDALADIT